MVALTVNLDATADPGLIWTDKERRYHTDIWDTEVVSNVSQPYLTVFAPEKDKATDIGVLIIPGGFYYAVSIVTEGEMLAEFLNRLGITAFVLTYRDLPTRGDAVQQLQYDLAKGVHASCVHRVAPLAQSDVQFAMRYLMKNAAHYQLAVDKVGIVGFSAGGNAGISTIYAGEVGVCPSFMGLIYPWLGVFLDQTPPDDAPPVFLAVAKDDQMGFYEENKHFIDTWKSSGCRAEAHYYQNGGHGFGMKNNGLESEAWVGAFCLVESALKNNFATLTFLKRPKVLHRFTFWKYRLGRPVRPFNPT